MAPHNYDETLAALAELQQSHELSIIKLSEPIAPEPGAQDDANRNSDVSDALGNPSPASLEADLSHYKASQDRPPMYS